MLLEKWFNRIFKKDKDRQLSWAENQFIGNLYEKECNRMWFLAYKITKNKSDTDDAVQQAFLSIIKKVQLLINLDEQKVSKYVFITVRNAALQILRKSKSNQYIDIDTVSLQSDTNIENEVLLEFDKAKALSAIKEMKSSYADALYLRYFLNFNYKDISDTLNITENAARQRVCYAKKILHKKAKLRSEHSGR